MAMGKKGIKLTVGSQKGRGEGSREQGAGSREQGAGGVWEEWEVWGDEITNNHQLPTINYQPSTINHQLSTITPSLHHSLTPSLPHSPHSGLMIALDY